MKLKFFSVMLLLSNFIGAMNEEFNTNVLKQKQEENCEYIKRLNNDFSGIEENIYNKISQIDSKVNTSTVENINLKYGIEGCVEKAEDLFKESEELIKKMEEPVQLLVKDFQLKEVKDSTSFEKGSLDNEIKSKIKEYKKTVKLTCEEYYQFCKEFDDEILKIKSSIEKDNDCNLNLLNNSHLDISKKQEELKVLEDKVNEKLSIIKELESKINDYQGFINDKYLKIQNCVNEYPDDEYFIFCIGKMSVLVKERISYNDINTNPEVLYFNIAKDVMGDNYIFLNIVEKEEIIRRIEARLNSLKSDCFKRKFNDIYNIIFSCTRKK
jgi:hypothetical protein